MPVSLASWNVNGLRSCMGKGFMDFIKAHSFDIIGLQETKMQPSQADFSFPGYHLFWNSAEKKGYSGTLLLTKKEPITVFYGMGIPEHDREGRIITLEYKNLFCVNIYTPNSRDALLRLDYRMEWEDAFRYYVNRLALKKPLVICGDLNVAHKEIDLKNPKTNVKNAGFTPQEREKMTILLESGFTDTYRLLYPDKTGAYTWWSFRANARKNNTGWRIDYFLVSSSLNDSVLDAFIFNQVPGSDHCPIGLLLEVEW